MKNAFVYVEFEALGSGGHHTYTLNSYALEVKRDLPNYDTILLCQQSGAEFKSIFCNYDNIYNTLPSSLNPNSIKSDLDNLALAITSSFSDIKSKYSSLIVYSHMPSPYSLLLLIMASKMLSSIEAQIVVRLCMTDIEWEWYKLPLTKLVSMTHAIKGFTYTTESVRLSQYFGGHVNTPIPLQFNPLDKRCLQFSRAVRSIAHRSCQPVCMSYLGEAREEKGFPILPQLIQFIAESSPYPLRFTLHTYSNSVNDTETIKNARTALTELQRSTSHTINCFNSPLSDPIYKQHLALSDVVLLPYDKQKYSIRGSGVAYEAYKNIACIITTKDTDIEQTFANTEYGLFAFMSNQMNTVPVDEVVRVVLSNRHRASSQVSSLPDTYHNAGFTSALLQLPLETLVDNDDTVFNQLNEIQLFLNALDSDESMTSIIESLMQKPFLQ